MSEAELKDRLESTTERLIRLWELLMEAYQYPLPETLSNRIHRELYPEKYSDELEDEPAKVDT